MKAGEGERSGAPQPVLSERARRCDRCGAWCRCYDIWTEDRTSFSWVCPKCMERDPALCEGYAKPE